jgi:hypothetical protein
MRRNGEKDLKTRGFCTEHLQGAVFDRFEGGKNTHMPGAKNPGDESNLSIAILT